MLTAILSVTLCAPDLTAIEAAYTTYLNYRVAERGQVSEALAGHWHAPALAGRDFLLLQPASGAEVYLRFVQAEPVPGYAPLKTYGWNATEILVQNPDALAERLADSPFQIIGPPRNLSSSEHIRAMQVLGPAQELLYLTYVAPDEPAFNLGTAQTEVDRVFIVVVGGTDLAALRQFYGEQLHMPVTAPFNVRVSVLSQAHGLDSEQLHPLALAQMSGKFLVELDQYPAGTVDRPCRLGELPPGVAIVSFGVKSLAALDVSWLSAPQVLLESPYRNRRAGFLRGPAGELIELVEL